MDQYLYAQLDENGICTAVSELGGEVNAPNMVRLAESEYAAGMLGWRYENDVWIEPEPPELQEPEPEPLTQVDILALAMADLYMQNLEILARLNEGGKLDG